MIKKDKASSYLNWIEIPELHDPCLVAGFYGWSNAGSVSSDTLQYLREGLDTHLVATLGDESFIDYALDRPVAVVEDGIIRYMEPMTAELTCWMNPAGNGDVLLLLGREPHVNWPMYARIILDAMHRLKVKRLYTIGGVQDTISHASPPVVSVVASSSQVVERTVQLEHGIRPAEYQGPISIHSCLVQSCVEADIEATSLWGHVPAYLHRTPRLVAKMISILNRTTGLACPLEPLRQKSIELDRKIDEALARDPNLKQFVETVEARDKSEPVSPRDEKVIRLNDFLRRDSRKDPEK